MAANPAKVFAEGGSRQDTLRIIWPELHEALSPPRADRPLPNCVMGGCAGKRRPAIGRLDYGHPACWRCAGKRGPGVRLTGIFEPYRSARQRANEGGNCRGNVIA